MNNHSSPVLERIKKLKTATITGQRAPHKPLLLLLALAAWQKGSKQVAFADIEAPLRNLLRNWAPPTKGSPQPELPYWYLQSDDLWQVLSDRELQRKTSGFPTLASLRQTSGSLCEDVQQWLTQDNSALFTIAWYLLEEYFLPTTYEAVLDDCGLSIPPPDSAGSFNTDTVSDILEKRKRSADFRRDVLKAYDYCCAVTGFEIRIGGGASIGCEAAHIQAHAFNGPDTVDNGLVLEPTLHLLFDRGIWSLSDDRRIIVSKEFTGSDVALKRIRDMHGQLIRDPAPGYPQLNPEYIRWHREAKLGGVFRAPALA
ncbi:MAG: hypothetical protein CMI08_17790 [Oceanospirillaceae bacterium]|uniref:phosphorothioated DNA-binding restriction endonuclease n=1 Tax=unclassified Thalassolituus TaxID=2624967 RepID=UPI000C096FC3|nr:MULTISPECIES: HNH endonuclease [unclassified Thalassolituus]MAK90073.1 hypothetical protein [Thalassolituus sp.]MAS26553.1 hypothetical protein [Oceanospirillaceae bacterium]MAY01019.1 hypothetical protein [Oceanospirillaceae bacterium]MBL33520.1 hypothetical protein [Oceanospirillaceae bacterium]MBL34622.1 hypothetical protein [Oceanospirillaceae bacterium]|tara:strand:- start:6431 stop:7369 length:939 start_codon:yes stop_codon:yes gene_type:complete